MDQIVYIKPPSMLSFSELGRHASAPAIFGGIYDDCSPCSDADGMQMEASKSLPLPNIPGWLESTPTDEQVHVWPRCHGQGRSITRDRQRAEQQAFNESSSGGSNFGGMPLEAAECSPLPNIPDWLECTPLDAHEHAWPQYFGQGVLATNVSAAVIAPEHEAAEQQVSKPATHNDEVSSSVDSNEDSKAFTVRSAAASLHDPLTVWTEGDGKTVVVWKFDKRKLASRDTKAVSQHFELALSNQQKAPFMIMLDPKPCGQGRCSKRFEKCETGVVSLKCQDTALAIGADVTFRIGLGGRYACDSPRGPVTHDFGNGSSICGLSVHDENWTLKDAIDEETGTVSVRLEIAPLSDSVQSKPAAGGA